MYVPSLPADVHNFRKDLYLVNGHPATVTDALEMTGRQPRYFFELVRQVLNATVLKLVCNLTQRKLIISEEFLHVFNFLQDEKMLDRRSFHLREKTADTVVVFIKE